ncbi:MFS transporter [Actinomadura sp. 6N118]|uniref:MFS transporter n=1 Tax=Actinomadura sp. 6N118 TaxID=3375151 RepID=UPI00378EDA03
MERRTWTLAVATTAGFLLVLDLIGVTLALPDMRRDLNAGLAEAQWAIDGYALPLAALLLLSGALSDRLGRRRLFLSGLGVFTLASGACALAQSALVLDLLRAVQGCGAAVLYGSAAPLIAAAFPAGRARNRALGVFAAGSGGALASGPVIGGALTALFGWRAIFVLTAVVGVVAFAVALRTLRESYERIPRPLDVRGTGYLTTGLVLVMWALIEGHRAGWGSPLVVGSLVVAALVFGRLLLRRVADPMIDLSLLRDRLYAANAAGAFVLHVAGAGSLAYFSMYVQGPMGAEPAVAGLWFLSYSLPALATPLLLAGRAHRIPPAVLVAAGPLLITVSSLLVAVTYQSHNWPALTPGFVLGGIGGGIGNLVAGQVALAAAPAERAGIASGITNTAKQVGVAVGVAVLGIPYDAGGLGMVMFVAAGIAALGSIPALALCMGRREGHAASVVRPPAKRSRNASS